MTVYGVIVTIIAILFAYHSYALTKICAKRADICNAWEAEFKRVQGISHNFVNSCRLISIHRSGRTNHFTFARGDKTFSIETVGLLSDDPRAWREQAGLEQ